MFKFASKRLGQSIISEWDEYLERLVTIERRLKVESQDNVTRDEFTKHLRGCVLEWDDADKHQLIPVIKEVTDILSSNKIHLSNEVTLVKTNGRDEWNSAYTRGKTIFLPPNKLKYGKNKFVRFLIHEVFHIIFRISKDRQKPLYNLIGFELINEVEIPESLKDRKLTNPDGALINSRFELEHNGDLISASPVILLKEGLGSVNNTEDILSSISIKMMAIEDIDGRWQTKLVNGQPLLLDPISIPELFKKVGRDFAADPDPNEILAEAFVKMVLDEQDEFIDLDRFRAVLQ